MPTQKKSSKTTSAKKAQVKVADLKPAKDAKGGRKSSAHQSTHSSSSFGGSSGGSGSGSIPRHWNEP